MAGGHFSHLVYHLPIDFKHIFHLLLTFVSFCPYRISTHFSHHSLEITLPLLTKPISHPPAHEFRETQKNLSKRQWVILIQSLRAVCQARAMSPKMSQGCCENKRWPMRGTRPVQTYSMFSKSKTKVYKHRPPNLRKVTQEATKIIQNRPQN